MAGARDRRRRPGRSAGRADRPAGLDQGGARRARGDAPARDRGRERDGDPPRRAARGRGVRVGRDRPRRGRSASSWPRDHGITALPGWHFGAATPHLRIPFGGRRRGCARRCSSGSRRSVRRAAPEVVLDRALHLARARSSECSRATSKRSRRRVATVTLRGRNPRTPSRSPGSGTSAGATRTSVTCRTSWRRCAPARRSASGLRRGCRHHRGRRRRRGGGFVMVVGDEVEQVYVGGVFRGRGIASVLMHEAERLVAAGGHDTAWLAVVPGNTRARAFYEKAGWRDEGPFDYMAETERGPVAVPCHRTSRQSDDADGRRRRAQAQLVAVASPHGRSVAARPRVGRRPRNRLNVRRRRMALLRRYRSSTGRCSRPARPLLPRARPAGADRDRGVPRPAPRRARERPRPALRLLGRDGGADPQRARPEPRPRARARRCSQSPARCSSASVSAG